MLLDGGGKYEITLVNPNSNREDSIRQMLGALEDLTAISTRIFATLRVRLEEQRSEVKSIAQRVTSAAQQVCKKILHYV
jgi:hypothetical protein